MCSSWNSMLERDKSTAKDAYVFLINWLERFPFRKTPLYIILALLNPGYLLIQSQIRVFSKISLFSFVNPYILNQFVSKKKGVQTVCKPYLALNH